MMPTNAGVDLTSMDRDPESGAYRVRYDPKTTPASLAVVAAKAMLSKVRTTDLEPLYESVDPEALDALTQDHDGRTSNLRISFDYEGQTVTVGSDGCLQIGGREPESTEDEYKVVSD